MNRFWYWWYLAFAVVFIVFAAEAVRHDMMTLAAVDGAGGLWAAWFAGRMRREVTLTVRVINRADEARKLREWLEEQLRDR